MSSFDKVCPFNWSQLTNRFCIYWCWRLPDCMHMTRGPFSVVMKPKVSTWNLTPTSSSHKVLIGKTFGRQLQTTMDWLNEDRCGAWWDFYYKPLALEWFNSKNGINMDIIIDRHQHQNEWSTVINYSLLTVSLHRISWILSSRWQIEKWINKSSSFTTTLSLLHTYRVFVSRPLLNLCPFLNPILTDKIVYNNISLSVWRHPGDSMGSTMYYIINGNRILNFLDRKFTQKSPCYINTCM